MFANFLQGNIRSVVDVELKIAAFGHVSSTRGTRQLTTRRSWSPADVSRMEPVHTDDTAGLPM
jgi:hypothetical protein